MNQQAIPSNVSYDKLPERAQTVVTPEEYCPSHDIYPGIISYNFPIIAGKMQQAFIESIGFTKLATRDELSAAQKLASPDDLEYIQGIYTPISESDHAFHCIIAALAMFYKEITIKTQDNARLYLLGKVNTPYYATLDSILVACSKMVQDAEQQLLKNIAIDGASLYPSEYAVKLTARDFQIYDADGSIGNARLREFASSSKLDQEKASRRIKGETILIRMLELNGIEQRRETLELANYLYADPVVMRNAYYIDLMTLDALLGLRPAHNLREEVEALTCVDENAYIEEETESFRSKPVELVHVQRVSAIIVSRLIEMYFDTLKKYLLGNSDAVAVIAHQDFLVDSYHIARQVEEEFVKRFNILESVEKTMQKPKASEANGPKRSILSGENRFQQDEGIKAEVFFRVEFLTKFMLQYGNNGFRIDDFLVSRMIDNKLTRSQQNAYRQAHEYLGKAGKSNPSLVKKYLARL